MSHSYVIELIVPQISDFAKLFLCILHNFFHFSRFFIIKTAHLHDFRYNLHCYFCFILTIFVFYFLYTIYKKSQSLFTEKILGFHFYIKIIQFFKNVFFL